MIAAAPLVIRAAISQEDWLTIAATSADSAALTRR